jgi:hypothetical protein
MMQHLTRGLELLEKSEFDARRDAEQMKLVIAEFRTASNNLEVINEETWTKDSFPTELSRALAAVENARMEWNAARLRFPVLSGKMAEQAPAPDKPASAPALFEGRSLGELFQIGLALTWPLAAVALLALGLMVFLVLRPH